MIKYQYQIYVIPDYIKRGINKKWQQGGTI